MKNSKNAKIQNINIDELKVYIDTKFKLDVRLIEDLKEYLLETKVDCCFFGHENQIFKYPRVFYNLRGHYLEEIIYGMFFKCNGEYKESNLINDLMRDGGAMKQCGYLVPNEMSEIFNRIINLGKSTI